MLFFVFFFFQLKISLSSRSNDYPNRAQFRNKSSSGFDSSRNTSIIEKQNLESVDFIYFLKQLHTLRFNFEQLRNPRDTHTRCFSSNRVRASQRHDYNSFAINPRVRSNYNRKKKTSSCTADSSFNCIAYLRDSIPIEYLTITFAKFL